VQNYENFFYNFANQTETIMTDKTTIVLENIQARKSVRNYTGEPVTKACLLALLKAGMAAPSARNRQPLAFVAVTERKILNALGEGLPYTKMLFKAGACIVVCGDTTVDLQQGATDLWYQDAAAATENILLAAEAMRLGAVWSALYPMADRENHVRKLIKLPPSVTPFSIIPVGHPTGQDQPKDKFKAEKIHWERW
jgi:nitroreductase